MLGGAVGDSVSTWANGGDLGDIASAAVDPQRRLLDFGIGFATQGVLNRVLPTTPTAPAASSVAAAERGGVGPVLQGQAGVARTADDLVAAGGRVFGEEVTVVTTLRCCAHVSTCTSSCPTGNERSSKSRPGRPRR